MIHISIKGEAVSCLEFLWGSGVDLPHQKSFKMWTGLWHKAFTPHFRYFPFFIVKGVGGGGGSFTLNPPTGSAPVSLGILLCTF